MFTPNLEKRFTASGAVSFSMASVRRVAACPASGASLRTICIMAARETAPFWPWMPRLPAAAAMVGMNCAMSRSSKAPCLPANASASNVALSSVGRIFSAFCSWKPVLVTSSRSELVAVATLPRDSIEATASFSSRPWATRSWMPAANFSGDRLVRLRPLSRSSSPDSALSSPWPMLAVLPMSLRITSKRAAWRMLAPNATPMPAAPTAACCHRALSNMPLKDLRPASAASFIVRFTFRPNDDTCI